MVFGVREKGVLGGLVGLTEVKLEVGLGSGVGLFYLGPKMD